MRYVINAEIIEKKHTCCVEKEKMGYFRTESSGLPARRGLEKPSVSEKKTLACGRKVVVDVNN